MKIKTFIKHLHDVQIHTVAGVPDSLLSGFCDYLLQEASDEFAHYTPANEGAAIAIGAGSYMASGKPSLVYMQNSGIGNTINPIASLTHKDVYNIPMLLLIGWRGEPGFHDEPQHVYQGKITCKLCEDMEIPYRIIDEHTDDNTLEGIFEEVKEAFANLQSFALIVRKGTFVKESSSAYKNTFTMKREDAIAQIIKHIKDEDIIVSTTGKISREVYEQCDIIKGNHNQCFLTVGSMGHASMIAFALAKENEHRRVICLDGDGAALMHMGALAFLGTQKPANLVHIILNNAAHESVGGMPTGAPEVSYAKVANACGYPYAKQIVDEVALPEMLEDAYQTNHLALLEIMVQLGSRSDLGRPKETPQVNKENFMKFYKENN